MQRMRIIIVGSCTKFEFACTDGAQCIPGAYKCDGNKDCRDASDETDQICKCQYIQD